MHWVLIIYMYIFPFSSFQSAVFVAVGQADSTGWLLSFGNFCFSFE
jgi:hypothetical protein